MGGRGDRIHWQNFGTVVVIIICAGEAVFVFVCLWNWKKTLKTTLFNWFAEITGYTNPRSAVFAGRESGCGSREDLTKLTLDRGKWLDKANETCLKYLQHVSKTFHPLYLATISPATISKATTVGGCQRRPPSVVEAAVEPAAGRLYNGGVGDKRLDTMNETFLKHSAIVSNICHPLYPAIYCCLDL